MVHGDGDRVKEDRNGRQEWDTQIRDRNGTQGKTHRNERQEWDTGTGTQK